MVSRFCRSFQRKLEASQAIRAKHTKSTLCASHAYFTGFQLALE